MGLLFLVPDVVLYFAFAFSSCMVHPWCMYGVTSGGTLPQLSVQNALSLGDLTSLVWTRWPPHCSPVSCIPGFIPQQHPNSHPPTLAYLYSGGLLFSFQAAEDQLQPQQPEDFVIQWTTTTLSPTRSALQPSGGVLLLGVSFLGFALSALGYPLEFSIFS